MAELNVSKKTIYQYFTDSFQESKKRLFIIPEYQRPYSWDTEKCDVLWNDIKNFHNGSKKNNEPGEYFLGTIVSCIEPHVGINIIDGQQRITSFFLLLRAFYSKLEAMSVLVPDDDEIEGLMAQIGSCIWDVNPMSKKVTDKSCIHIKSLVATEKDNEVFHQIIQTGKLSDIKSNYAQNYDYFYKQCEEYAKDNPLDWKQLCLCVLNQCIILPIECKDLDSALTIFSTLNDRGLPLSDSDIFKAELYRLQPAENKEIFTQKWKEMSEILNEVGLSLNDIFRYYSHYIRAFNGDKSKEIGLRKFYSDNQYEKLKYPNIMDDLCELALFWNKLLKNDDEISSPETKKLIHCLQCYPNEYWKYPTTVFYFRHKDKCKDLLPEFLKNIMSFLFIKFVENPTVNAIKDPTFQACIDIYQNGSAHLSYPIIEFENRMNALCSSKITKPMILLNAYLFDKEQTLLPADFQIEHIFPQKWDSTYFTWTKETADQYINKLGNKIVFERRLNVQASNGFFSRKKAYYQESAVAEVKSLTGHMDWTQEDIDIRNEQVIGRLKDFFETHLQSKEVTTEKLLECSGGDSSVILYAVVNGDKQTYRLNLNNKDEDFEHLDNALKKIDVGLLRYGNTTFFKDDVKQLVGNIIHETKL